MDEKLQILRALYGEGEDREEVRRRLQEDPALWEEYQALSEAKFLLDHRRRERPSPLVLDTILAAAAGDAPAPPEVHPGRWRDRRPAPGRAVRFRAFGLVTAALAVVMLAGTGLWQTLYRPADVPVAVQDEATAVAPAPQAAPPVVEAPAPEPADAGTFAARQAPAPATASPEAAPAASPAASRAAGRTALQLAGTAARGAAAPGPGADGTALSWDEADDVRQLHRRIELLEASVEQPWDAPAVPLEMLPSARPTGAPAAGFRQAGQRQPPRDRGQ